MFFCLILTIVIEYPIVWIFYKGEKGIFKMVILVNILTNPIVVFLSNLWFVEIKNYSYVTIFILEVFAILVEGNIYSKFFDTSVKKAYFISLIANVVAYVSGIIIAKLVY